MSNSRDQVFQLSLMEIAFTLVFILLILTGWVQYEADKRQTALEAQVRIEAEAASKAKALAEQAQKALIDLPAKSDIEVALALKKHIELQLREQLGLSYPHAYEATLAKDLVGAIKEVQVLRRAAEGHAVLTGENSDLRGQVAFLKGKLEAQGGRDFPPCWAGEDTGRVEYLLAIEILPEGLKVSPAWPAKRKEIALALPGIEKLTVPKPHTLKEFNALMQGIDKLSKEKNCRHYVTIKNQVNDLELFNRYRYGIENYFYKFEVRN